MLRAVQVRYPPQPYKQGTRILHPVDMGTHLLVQGSQASAMGIPGDRQDHRVKERLEMTLNSLCTPKDS